MKRKFLKNNKNYYLKNKENYFRHFLANGGW